jgi:hypothetical protein
MSTTRARQTQVWLDQVTAEALRKAKEIQREEEALGRKYAFAVSIPSAPRGAYWTTNMWVPDKLGHMGWQDRLRAAKDDPRAVARIMLEFGEWLVFVTTPKEGEEETVSQ